MRRYTIALAIAGVCLALGARTAQAQRISGPAALKARAKISGDSAKKIARAQVPGSTIKSGEIEEEKGKLLYSFDLSVAGKSGVDEVHVDALTGAVLAHEHESAAAEKAEHKAEHKARKADEKAEHKAPKHAP